MASANTVIWQMIKRFLLFAEVPWPLRVVRGVFVFFLIFGLAAAVAWLAFGRNAEMQVVDFAEGLTEIVGIFFVPVLLFGLIAVPFHRWIGRKAVDTMSKQNRDRSKSD